MAKKRAPILAQRRARFSHKSAKIKIATNWRPLWHASQASS